MDMLAFGLVEGLYWAAFLVLPIVLGAYLLVVAPRDAESRTVAMLIRTLGGGLLVLLALLVVAIASQVTG